MTTQVALAFSVAGIRLGVEVAAVQEVIAAVRLVTVPEMPALMSGFLRVDGGLVPVIRLELLMGEPAGTPPARPTLTDRMVITAVGGLRMAWLAAGDMELVRYQAAELSPVPEGSVLNDCAAGVIPAAPPVVLLEADRILLEAERVRLEQLRKRHEARLASSSTEASA